jgi:hypothetical protein
MQSDIPRAQQENFGENLKSKKCYWSSHREDQEAAKKGIKWCNSPGLLATHYGAVVVVHTFPKTTSVSCNATVHYHNVTPHLKTQQFIIIHISTCHNFRHYPSSYVLFNTHVQETGFCLYLQVDQYIFCRDFYFLSPCVKQKPGRWIKFRTVIAISLYLRQKPTISLTQFRRIIVCNR